MINLAAHYGSTHSPKRYPRLWPGDDGQTPVYLPEAIVQYINETSEGRFFSDDSYSTGESYWMNHCSQCGAKIGAHYIHRQPGQGFFPTADEDFAKISGHLLVGPFVFNDPDLGHSDALDVWLCSIREGVTITEAYRRTSGFTEIKWFEVMADVREAASMPATLLGVKDCFISQTGRLCSAGSTACLDSRELAEAFAAWITPVLRNQHRVLVQTKVIEVSKSLWAPADIASRQKKIRDHSVRVGGLLTAKTQ